MKTKILSLFLLTLISCLVVVSAASTFSVSTNTLTFEELDDSKTFTITPDNPNSDYEVITPTILDDEGNTIQLNVLGNLMGISSVEIITINTTENYDDLTIGNTYEGDIVVNDINNSTETETIAVSFVPTFCKDGEAKTSDFELSITDFSINNDDGDDEDWSPLDKITLEIEVSNEGNEKVKDVMVEIDLFDPDGKSIINDFEFMNSDEEQIDLGSIDDGNDETVEFEFKVPTDFEDDTYRLVVKVYGDKEGEKEVCTSKSTELDNTYYHEINGERETDEEKHIVVNNIHISPETAQCGERAQVSAEVYNIGDEDYEDQVKVTLEIKELGIELEKTIREDFDQGDSSPVEFDFDIPEDADEKAYTLEFRTHYDYNDRHDVYEIVSDEKFTNFESLFKVQGGCEEEVVEVSDVQISPDFDSETPEAIAGKQVIIQATLRNTGDLRTTYTTSVFGNSAWSSLVAIDPTTVVLESGESRDVSIILKIDEDAQGDKEFTIRTSYDGETKDQPVLVPVEEKEVQGEAFVNHLKTNWFIYLIVIINIILIIAIIAVVRRMLSPRPAL